MVLLCPIGPESADLVGIVKWWECRRPAYNGLVILIAVPSYLLFVAILFGSNAVRLNRHGVNSGELIFDPIEAFIAMNVFYAAGWAIELTLRAVGIRDRRLGPDLAKIGLVVSRIVVLLPLVLAIFDWLVRLHTPGTRSIFDYGAS